MSEPLLSIISPVFNEGAGLREFHRRLAIVLGEHQFDAEIILINDGSKDNSLSVMREIKQRDSRVRILDFSRNFGHQIAIKAGIDHARGKVLVTMDSDLQDPPELIPKFLEKWKEGFDVVYAVRSKREGESLFKKVTALIYYRLLKAFSSLDIPTDAGDFRLISRPVADALKKISDRNLYLRGLVSWVGFKQTGVPMNRQKRFAGKTSYSLGKMWNLAWSGLMFFSTLPLQIVNFFGFMSIAASALCLITHHSFVLGAVLFLGGAQLIGIGILASYLARILEETRTRPLYILTECSDHY